MFCSTKRPTLASRKCAAVPTQKGCGLGGASGGWLGRPEGQPALSKAGHEDRFHSGRSQGTSALVDSMLSGPGPCFNVIR